MTTPTNTITVLLQIASPDGESVFFYSNARDGAPPDAPGPRQFASLIAELEQALTAAHKKLCPLPDDHDRN